MRTETFEFAGHSGDRLSGKLERPAGEIAAVAVYAHCFTCTKEIAAARRVAARLAMIGVATLRFDFTGLGRSGGRFAETTFSSNVADLQAAMAALSARIGAPSLMVGHSLGGAAAIAASAQAEGVKAVATIGAPYDPAHVIHNFAPWLDEIRAKGEARTVLAGREIQIGQVFIDDLQAQSAIQPQRIAMLRAALLVLHAPRDAVVGIENASAIFTAAKHPKSFVTLDDADHLLSRPEDAEYAADVIGAWAARYLPKARTAAQPEQGVRVTEADPNGFLQHIAAARGRMSLADEPKDAGGTDLGLTPYELVASGLGACTAMTIRMYARRKNLPLDGVSVDVTHDRIHAEDCADCAGPGGGAARKIDVFRRVIRLEGDLNETQRAKLLEIADKCPVHRTLEGSIRVETRMI